MFIRCLLCLVVILIKLSYTQELIFQANDPALSAWPLSATETEDRISASFGPRLLGDSYDYHRGLDMAAADSTPVVSVLPGVVVRVEPAIEEGEPLARLGNFIVIAHNDLTLADSSTKMRQTTYIHLSEFLVAEGDSVNAGDSIALSGNTGEGINTYHLHFEYYINRNNGTISASDTRHPIRLLPYTPKVKDVSVTRDAAGDSLRLTIREHHSAIDLVRFEMSTNTGIADTIDLEGRIGVNGSSEDDNPYEGVRISPRGFTSTSDSLEREFIFDTSVNNNNSWNNTAEVYVKIYTARDQITDYTFELDNTLPVNHSYFTTVAAATNFRLLQNYPNPFNPSTTISYSLPYQSTVKLTVFDIRGQEVMTLLNADKPPGNYQMQWNGLDHSGNQVNTGVYFCQLNIRSHVRHPEPVEGGGSGSYSQTIKMVYLR